MGDGIQGAGRPGWRAGGVSMKRRLWLKLIGGFTFIIILGGVILYIAVQRSTRSRYRELVRESDLAAAEYLVPFFADYYAAEGSWRGVESLFAGPGNPGGPASRHGMGPDSSARRGMGVRRGMGHEMMMIHRGFGPPRIILTDREGNIIADSAADAPGERLERPGSKGRKRPPAPDPPENLKGGMPVRITDGSAGRAVAFLYVGSMIGPVLEPADRAFLRSVNRSVFLTTVLVVMLAAGLGTILVINITSPVWSLHEASKRIGRGDLSARAGKNGTDRMKNNTATAGKRRDELGELTEQFNSMADSLEKAAESRKRMIADTAHELRTPVSLIQGKLEMILEGVYPPDRNTIASVHEETKLLAGLVEELQELADADAGALLLVKKETSLKPLVETAAGMFAPEIERKNITLSVHLPQQDVTAYVDPGKITQVVSNLLSNSVRHTPEGGNIYATLEHAENIVRFSIANTGSPIPEDKLESIFNRFYRIDISRSRKEGGKGLGLAICKAIVEAHGGRIWAENVRSGECPQDGVLRNARVRFVFSLTGSV